MTKNWGAKFAVAVAAGALIAAVSSAPVAAAGICPSPGTGLPGALNMIHDATMLTVPMVHNLNGNGNAGMTIAVHKTTCPPS